MNLKIIPAIEEQISVQFTGKLNILSNFNRQYLGQLTFVNGEIVKAIFQGQTGLKAFFQIVVQEYSLNSFFYVIEPEYIEDVVKDVHLPYAVLKERMEDVISSYQSSLKLKPPENVKIIISNDFMAASHPVSLNEFQVLLTLSEWNTPYDIYQHCHLLDHEITMALVELRKKKALKILAGQTN